MKEKIFYQCFSENQANYLKSKGHSVLLVAKHIKTEKVFWCFIINDKLKEDLSLWSNKEK